MADISQEFTEFVQFSDGIFPANKAVGTYYTDWLRMNDAQRLEGITRVGAMAAGATVDFHLEQATAIVGSGAKAIAGKAITQIVQGVDADNDQRVIELISSELDVTNQYDCVRGVLTIAVDAVYVDVLMLRHVLNYKPPVTAGVIDEIVH